MRTSKNRSGHGLAPGGAAQCFFRLAVELFAAPNLSEEDRSGVPALGDGYHSFPILRSNRVGRVVVVMSNVEFVKAAKPRVITEDDVKALSRFRDESGHAVSFYFKPRPGTRSERDAMLMNLRAHDIISNDFLRGEKNHGLLRDLDAVLELSEKNAVHGGPVKVVFACHDRGVWQEFSVPSSTPIIRLEAGKQFEVGPLLRLLQMNDRIPAD